MAKGSKPALDPTQIKQCFELSKEGESYKAIADEFGIHRNTVRGYLKRYKF